jgi:uncharacterized membrane protein HdeD (DUF308 family)
MPTEPEALRTLGRPWWLPAILGVLYVVAGVLAILHPGFSLQVIGVVLGIYILIAALATIVAGASGDAGSRSTAIVLGIVGVIAGLIFIRHPGDSLLALVVAAGIYLIVGGVIRFVEALALPADRALPLALGAVDVALGVLLLALPDVTLGTLAVLFGISMLLQGAFDIARAVALRRLQGPEPSPPAGAGLTA